MSEYTTDWEKGNERLALSWDDEKGFNVIRVLVDDGGECVSVHLPIVKLAEMVNAINRRRVQAQISGMLAPAVERMRAMAIAEGARAAAIAAIVAHRAAEAAEKAGAGQGMDGGSGES